MKNLVLLLVVVFALSSCAKPSYSLLHNAPTSQNHHPNQQSYSDTIVSQVAAAQVTEATPLQPAELDEAVEASADSDKKIIATPPPAYKQPSELKITPKQIVKQLTKNTAKFDKKNNTHAKDDRKTNTAALLSFIFGLVGLFIGGIPFGVAAAILGIIGLVKIGKYPERFKGKGFAIVGLILGIIDFLLVVAFLSAM